MTDTTEEPQTEEIVDEARAALLEAMSSELGDALVDSHLIPGKDLVIRVTSESWGETAAYLRWLDYTIEVATAQGMPLAELAHIPIPKPFIDWPLVREELSRSIMHLARPLELKGLKSVSDTQ